MSVVLSELLNAEETVELARLLLAVDNIDLIELERELLIRALSVHINLDSIGAVHRLSAVNFVILLSGYNEHTVLVVIPVARSDPELLL